MNTITVDYMQKQALFHETFILVMYICMFVFGHSVNVFHIGGFSQNHWKTIVGPP